MNELTNWERWIAKQSRKDVICAVVVYSGTGRCDKNCILYRVCGKEYSSPEEREKACNEFLDSEAIPTRDAVVINLASIRDEARMKGYDGYVKTLDRAIELIEEADE